MTTTTHRSRSDWAVGLTVFAAVLMLLTGVLHIVQAIVALVNDEFYVAGRDYVFKFDLTAWGWIHLVLGVVVALAGLALFQGATWARLVAVALAALSVIANFLWIPYYPFWSLAAMALGVLVIWALAVHGRDITRT